MSDDLKKKKQDRHFISLSEKWERKYWTRKFGITKNQLREAVEETGSHGVDTITDYLIDKGLYSETLPDDTPDIPQS